MYLQVAGIAIAIVVLYFLYRSYVHRWDNTLIYKKNDVNERILKNCPSLVRYSPTPWLVGGSLNTFYQGAYRKHLKLRYHREIVDVMDDGAKIALDWHTKPLPNQPVLVILHGLTGGSSERYIQFQVKIATKAGFAVCVMIARGCAGTKLSSKKCFSGAYTHDIRFTVKHIDEEILQNQKKTKKVPIFAVGYSLGAGILTKYVAEEGASCKLTCAVACCMSFDFIASSKHLEAGLNRHTWNQFLLANLKRYLSKHRDVFDGNLDENEGGNKKAKQDAVDVKYNVKRALSASIVREFDSQTVTPMFGYNTVYDYYHDASNYYRIGKIKIPMLFLNAADDPICPVTETYPTKEIEANENLIAVITQEGGHVAWATHPFAPGTVSWDNFVVEEYFDEMLRQAGYSKQELATFAKDNQPLR
jgi:predicted alpha/beta-fold hydrolase